MKGLIVIPIYNESETLNECLDTFRHQTYKNIEIVLVDDGSTDSSLQLIQDYCSKHPNFSFVSHPAEQKHQPGSKIVQAFLYGLQSKNLEEYDFISKFDADLLLPENYFERIVEKLTQDATIGMIAGQIFIPKNGEYVYENITRKDHIRGALKTYTKDCYKAMNGIRPTLGWDNIDEYLAQKAGYTVFVFQDLPVKQIRPTGAKYTTAKSEKLGLFFYKLGLSPVLSIVSALKASYYAKSPLYFFNSMKVYFKNYMQQTPRAISQEEVHYIRTQRWKELKEKFF